MSTLFRKHPVASFYVLALLIGSVFSIFLIGKEEVSFTFAIMAASSASVAAIIVTWGISGSSGVKKLLRKFLIWRIGWQWWVAVLLFPVVWWLIAAIINSQFGGTSLDASKFQPVSFLFIYALVRMIQAGLGEEFGWRGFALTRLQSRYNALVAGIIVGVMHGLWHWPMYFIVGTPQYYLANESGFVAAILLDTLMVTIWSIIFTWFYNNSKGSVLVVSIFHALTPAWVVYFGLIGEGIGVDLPLQLWYMGVVALTAVVIVAIYGPENLSRTLVLL